VSYAIPDASDIRANPIFVALAMSTAIRLRLSSRERGFASPAWVKQSRNLEHNLTFGGMP